MSPLGRRCCRLVRLLTVLWAVVGRSRASQSWPPANVGTQINSGQLNTLSLMIAHDVTTEIRPVINKLAVKIDGFETRLTGLNSRLKSIETLFGAFHVKQDSFSSRLGGLASRVDSSTSRLDSRLDEVASEVSSTANGLGSRLDQVISRVDSLAAEQSDRLDSVSSRLDYLSSRLSDLGNRKAPRDCSDLPAGSTSGIHLIQPGLNLSRPPVAAYCDMDTDGGGWTVFQRRKDIEPRQNFDLDWSEYKAGFGELDKEFWWGLDNLWKMTAPQNRQHELRVELADYEGGRRYAAYRQVEVASEAEGYRLSVTGYTGNARDSLRKQNGEKFSTNDRDQDSSDEFHCAQEWHGGWWFRGCYHAFLNGPHRGAEGVGDAGIHWNGWRGGKYSLKETVMMIRPVNAK